MEQTDLWQVFRNRHGVWVGTPNGRERYEVVAVMGDSLQADQQVSNAHLVAAAPALLEAASDAFLLLQALQLLSRDDEDESITSVLAILRSAIVRARKGS